MWGISRAQILSDLSHVFLQAPPSFWKASKQTKAVLHAVVSVMTLWLVWCFLNILIQPTLLNSSPGRRIWWTKLTFAGLHILRQLWILWLRDPPLSWGILFAINKESKLANKQQSFRHFCYALFWDLQGSSSQAPAMSGREFGHFWKNYKVENSFAHCA